MFDYNHSTFLPNRRQQMTDIAQHWCGDDDSLSISHIFSLLLNKKGLSDSIKLVELSCLSVSVSTRLGRLLSIIIREFRSCENTKEFNTKLNNFEKYAQQVTKLQLRHGAERSHLLHIPKINCNMTKIQFFRHDAHAALCVSCVVGCESKINKRETENEKKKELQLGRSYTHEKSVGLCHVLGNSNDRLCVA